MPNRWLLVLSLLGMILAVHLWIQKERGFDQGCLGLAKPGTVNLANTGCRAAGLRSTSEFLGVSNAAWGYAFFFTLSLGTFAKTLVSAATARRLHQVSEVAITGALIYAAYLFYVQAWVVHAYCVLCLTLSGLIAAIFLIHVLMRVRDNAHHPENRTQDLGFSAGALFTALGLMLGVLLMIDRVGLRGVDQSVGSSQFTAQLGEALPKFIDGDKLAAMRACHFDWDAPALVAEQIGIPDTPFLGKADGVPVVIFFDPNCPHCAEYYPAFLKLVDRYRDRARFYVLPRMLWNFSEQQIEALELARQQGKYYELWKLMFAHARPRGMKLPEIAALLNQLGMKTDDLAAQLAAVRPATQAALTRAVQAGIDSTPTIYIDGNKVFDFNQSPECVATLVDRRSGQL